MARQYLMRAKDSVTSGVFTWLSANPDFAGIGYPGPNGATNTFVVSYHDDGVGGGGGGGGLTPPANPADNGAVAVASAGDLIYVSGAPGEYLAWVGSSWTSATLDSDAVANASGVSGAAVSDALDSLSASIAAILPIDLASEVTGDLPFVNIAQLAALSLFGNPTNALADMGAITAASDHQVLRRSGTALGFGAVNLAQSNAVTGLLPFANIANGSACSVFGRSANTSGVQASISAASDGQVLRRASGALGFGAIDATSANAIVPNFGAQNIQTTGAISGGALGSTIGNGGRLDFGSRGQIEVTEESGTLGVVHTRLNDSSSLTTISRTHIVRLTTTNATPTQTSFAIPASSVVDLHIDATAFNSGDTAQLKRTWSVTYRRLSTGAPALIGALTDIQPLFRDDTDWTLAEAISGNDYLITLTGEASTTINWFITITASVRTKP